jgi:DNA (cytosine-5)-methyltransferase 1
MRYLICELQARQFAWAYRIIDTRAFGLPQRRRRVFLLASRTSDPKRVLIDQDEGEPPASEWSDEACGFYWTEGNSGLGWAVDAVPPLKGGSGTGIPSPPGILLKPESSLAKMIGFRIVVPSIESAERLQGFEPGLTAPADAEERGRKGPRWRLVGNAVSVPVTEWIGERLLAFGNQPLEQTDGLGELALDLEGDISLPNAAWGVDGRAYRSAVSSWPVTKPYQHLAEFLDPTSLIPLSARAASGFRERLERSKLRGKDLLIDPLREHLKHLGERQTAQVRQLAPSLRRPPGLDPQDSGCMRERVAI